MSKVAPANALGVSVAFADALTYVLKLHGQRAVFGKLDCHKVVGTRLALFPSIEL